MRRSEFRHAAPSVVCALAVFFVSSSSFGQAQRSPTDADSHLSSIEPSRSTSGSGSGFAGTTPILHESVKLTASEAVAFDLFGNSVSMSGNTAVFGAPLVDCPAGVDCGSAYVFRFDGTVWVEEQKLTASDAAVGDEFGFSVSVSGDTAVVGAPRDDCAAGGNCGSAYVFRFDGSSWVEEQKLTVFGAEEFDAFGGSASVSGRTVVVGARWENCAAGPICGSAYVFRFDGSSWVEEQRLTASEPGAHDQFGGAVSISGETAIVGSRWHDCAAGVWCGSAYVFRFNGTNWFEEQKLTASDEEEGDFFGFSVSISGDTAAVGATRNDCATGVDSGSAYIFRFDGTTWVEEQELTASDGAAGDLFGSFVSTSGKTAVVGARWDDCTAGVNCVSAYVYRFDGTSWSEEHKLTATDPYLFDTFGVSVSVSGDTVVVGAFADDCAAGRSCGSAYVFDLPPVELQVAIDIKPGSDTNPVNLSSRGVLPVAVLTTSVADGDLIDFDAADVDPSSLTLAGAAPHTKGRNRRTGNFEDVDGDGDLDLVVHFPIPELDLTEQHTEAVLLGQTLDETPIRGSDTIRAFRIHRFRVDNLRDGK